MSLAELQQLEQDWAVIATRAYRNYWEARKKLLDIRLAIIAERRKATMPNSMQTKGKVTRKAAKVPKNLRGMGAKAKGEKTRATKKNAKRP